MHAFLDSLKLKVAAGQVIGGSSSPPSGINITFVSLNLEFQLDGARSIPHGILIQNAGGGFSTLAIWRFVCAGHLPFAPRFASSAPSIASAPCQYRASAANTVATDTATIQNILRIRLYFCRADSA